MAAQKGKSPQEFEYAIATEADYVGVMDIDRNIYDGVDYLPKMYFEYINDPYRLCVVVKHHGEVIGFVMRYIVDAGKTIISQAERVRPDYQGLRISAHADEYALKILTKKYDLEKNVWTSVNKEASDGLVTRHSDTTYIMKRPRFSLDFTPQQLDLVMKSEGFAEVKEMSGKYISRMVSPSGFKEIMTKFPQDVTAMTPQGFWVVNWEPFQTLISNCELMMRESNVYVTMANDNSLLAVSFGATVEVKVGLRYRTDYFVRPELANDKELLVSHLVEHLIHIHQFYRNIDVSFSLLYPGNVAEVGSEVKQLVATKLDMHCVKSSEKPCLVLLKQLSPSKSTSKL